ncbi:MULTISPECIES: LysR family transcriptional regulator ArgP [unclassified Salinivibrio]|uniref:LysR family transcriptional regulator ArgP n=1 Tax=unclassified Salinivibrio TaxID=2636825 RepID=UPI00084BE92F|nr:MULTISPECIES: LysR family transcriptional regulator ArgP [unclassified Salinivibrio]ODQ01659.1 transcriptional regulator ArgP [Salinivibrio sp. DV]OOF24531.1 transcriptional regulator ArgP [Salinivibrio sp. IB872]
MDYRGVEALDAVITLGGFERAAAALFITQSAVSQRIKQLERQIAQPVMVREQPPRLTPIGQRLLGLYRRVQLLEQETLPELAPDADGSVLSVSIATNADSLATWLLPALAPLLASQAIDLNLLVEDESRTLKRMRSGEAIAAISTDSTPMHGCDCLYLGRMDYSCVATPAFSQRYFSQGIDREALMAAPAVIFDAHDDMHADFLASYFAMPAAGWRRHIVRSSEAFVAMASKSMAYCLIPRLMVSKQLEEGTLIDVMPGKVEARHLYWHYWAMESGVLSEMTHACQQAAQRALVQS